MNWHHAVLPDEFDGIANIWHWGSTVQFDEGCCRALSSSGETDSGPHQLNMDVRLYSMLCCLLMRWIVWLTGTSLFPWFCRWPVRWVSWQMMNVSRWSVMERLFYSASCAMTYTPTLIISNSTTWKTKKSQNPLRSEFCFATDRWVSPSVSFFPARNNIIIWHMCFILCPNNAYSLCTNKWCVVKLIDVNNVFLF